MILNIHGLDGKAENTAYTIPTSVFGEEFEKVFRRMTEDIINGKKK